MANLTYSFSPDESYPTFPTTATSTAATSTTAVANHSFSPEIITTVSDAEADKALRINVCRIYGLTLDEYINQITNSNSNKDNLHSVVNDSYHLQDSNDLDADLSSLAYGQQHNDSLSSLLHHSTTDSVGDANLDLNLDLLTNHDVGGNATVCFGGWDGILCWPETPVGQTATLSCFKELNTILYDSSKNATRFCSEGPNGGEWNNTIYDLCQPVPNNSTINDNESNILALTTGVYFCGYCLSLAAVTIAMIIFLAFKELRCLRNTIHTNLIVTYILADTLWIITSSTTFTSTSALPDATQGQTGGGHTHVSCVTYILLHYFHLTNFFWMFVEGLYLYVLVVQTFVAENIKLRIYVSIGWGLPLAIVICWAIAKWLLFWNQGPVSELDETCVWLGMSIADWIYKAPVILTLAANSLFLLQIMWVLITKLRSATNPETQQSMKAAKALIVLMPLLGITYLLMLAGSREPAYEFTRALLISTQGFLVALLYCFLNGEVRKAIRHRWNRLRTPGFNCCNFGRRRRLQQMRDWSPRSRTENCTMLQLTISEKGNLQPAKAHK
ncbi:diuretic hormone receptor isoform X2 [Folsomia candida]|uniref:diuretic hormone receptor isoform X2 n=1 Tax=Folsomia candida TaxID=158441 RepID=UPI001604E088|nr:diuretic hormone receptor isoform X2 [Folsomia candida]